MLLQWRFETEKKGDKSLLLCSLRITIQSGDKEKISIMGRKLKRVPLDFQWEIGKTWSGFVNPHEHHECLDCEGLGWSKDFNLLKAKWYSGDNPNWKPNPFIKGSRYDPDAWSHNVTTDDIAALIEGDRLWDFTRVPINDEQKEIVRQKIERGENSWLPFNNGYVPTPQEVNEWSLIGLGHDSINCCTVIEARLAKEGKSHLCPNCNGSGEHWESEIAKDLYENWKNYEPPTGDGFQLWSDSSPMTPVFKSLEELCEYCEKENVSVFGKETATKERWMDMLSKGLVFLQDGNNIFI